MAVSKIEAETGRVRVSTHVEERLEHVSETLRRRNVEVERVPIDRFVDQEPAVREEDGVLIFPVVEEVLVKRLLLKEELRVNRTSMLDAVERDVTLRTLRVDVERSTSTPKT